MSVAKITMQGGQSAGSALAINGGVANALTATGSGQSDAYALGVGTNYFGTVAASTGARLFAGAPGDEVWVHNAGAQTLTVYPPTSAQINAAGTNAGVSVTANTGMLFKCISATQWVAIS